MYVHTHMTRLLSRPEAGCQIALMHALCALCATVTTCCDHGNTVKLLTTVEQVFFVVMLLPDFLYHIPASLSCMQV